MGMPIFMVASYPRVGKAGRPWRRPASQTLLLRFRRRGRRATRVEPAVRHALRLGERDEHARAAIESADAPRQNIRTGCTAAACRGGTPPAPRRTTDRETGPA